MPAHEFIVDSSGPTFEIPPAAAAADEETADPEARVQAWMERARAAEEAFANLLHEQSQRSDHQVLVSVAQLLEEQLAELKHIRAALGATGSVSSVELTVDSKAAVKPTVKVYDLDATSACEQAQTLFDELVIKYGPKTP